MSDTPPSGKPLSVVTPMSAEEELRLLKKEFRKLERDHGSVLRNARISEEIAENSKAVLLQAQMDFYREVEERKGAEAELEKIFVELDMARASREAFIALLVEQLKGPTRGAIGMLDIIASAPLDRAQEDLLELAIASVKAIQTLLASAERISQHHQLEGIGENTIDRLFKGGNEKD